MIERAAVVGREFSVAALAALVPPEVADRARGAPRLAGAQRACSSPARSSDPDGDQYGYRHILIRDAAYESLPKQTRAELHERFADWLEERLGERLEEHEEFVGYHLEQAQRYLGELGPADEHARALAAQGGVAPGCRPVAARSRAATCARARTSSGGRRR